MRRRRAPQSSGGARAQLPGLTERCARCGVRFVTTRGHDVCARCRRRRQWLGLRGELDRLLAEDDDA